jgi:hypothetical protein
LAQLTQGGFPLGYSAAGFFSLHGATTISAIGLANLALARNFFSVTAAQAGLEFGQFNRQRFAFTASLSHASGKVIGA